MLDDLDRALVHALHIDGRATFSRIGSVLGVSTQTVARRYQRLRERASLRVVGLAGPHRAGRAQWMLRLTASPATAQTLAVALARRADTSWVKLASGGTEIVAIVDTPADSDHALLMHDIPRAASVTAVSAHYLLHIYLGGPTAWPGRLHVLTDQQRRDLTPGLDHADGALTSADDALLAALGRDGRATHAELASATGWSASTVARRMAELRASGALFYDLEVDDSLFGATTKALLWMSVIPGRLDEVATALTEHQELAFVAATTGPTNLVADALCTDPAALHRYLVHRIGPLDGIRHLETAPVLRTVKAAGPLSRA
ncbi:Lrp/AsnC family transcriptional regulator [Pseudonocardia spinosispora]|uniref:Lrp/AsnC family transcriptional regulator n=1 Tax=Pseudonocardia spinosispora TaxID=103441 RepID=UPI0004908047|nr:AsnC family transcriptional regulator [Pseudonocardia spinosispora]